MSLSDHTRLPNDGTARLLSAHPVAARALPHPHVRWALSDRLAGTGDIEPMPAALEPQSFRLREYDIVLVDERIEVPESPRTDVANVYRTRPGVVEWVRANVPEPATLPCGHQGVRNLGEGRYGCIDERCSRTFGRATAEAVVGGER